MKKITHSWMPPLLLIIDAVVLLAAVIRIGRMVHKHKDFKINIRYMVVHVSIVTLLAATTALTLKLYFVSGLAVNVVFIVLEAILNFIIGFVMLKFNIKSAPKADSIVVSISPKNEKLIQSVSSRGSK